MNYKILRVLNNNSVVSVNDNGDEIVITGPGIAFSKKYGGYVNGKDVDKVYKLDRKEDTNKLIELFNSIPNEYIEIVDDVIKIAFDKYKIELKNSIYIVLSDHINSALDRYKQGIIFENKLLWEIKNLYREEFSIAKEAITMIETLTSIKLTDDEAAFIALHIVNSEVGYNNSDIKLMTRRTKDILNIIDLHFSKPINKDSMEYNRLLTHMKYFVNRVMSKDSVQMKEQEAILNNMKESYPSSMKCIDKIAHYLKVNENYTLKDIEKLYLLIHISRLYEM